MKRLRKYYSDVCETPQCYRKSSVGTIVGLGDRTVTLKFTDEGLTDPQIVTRV